MQEGVLTSEVQTKEKQKGQTPAERIKICMSCPLFVKDLGVCNSELWLNPKTMETAKRQLPGYKKGCGCLVVRKVNNPSSHCHCGLW